MTIQVTKIGNIDNGIDGSEEYLLLTDSEDNLTENQAWEYLHPLVYRDTDTPGAYFCHYKPCKKPIVVWFAITNTMGFMALETVPLHLGIFLGFF
jgi:hypothetical protein